MSRGNRKKIWISIFLYLPGILTGSREAFFAKVQNKLHSAFNGHTAAELIMERADAGRENMGLISWENAPNEKIVRTDVFIFDKHLDLLGRNDEEGNNV